MPAERNGNSARVRIWNVTDTGATVQLTDGGVVLIEGTKPEPIVRGIVFSGATSEIISALSDLLDYADRNTCLHETTHRGGYLWTICDDCGRKWADDEGGFKPHCDDPAVASAREVLRRTVGETA